MVIVSRYRRQKGSKMCTDTIKIYSNESCLLLHESVDYSFSKSDKIDSMFALTCMRSSRDCYEHVTYMIHKCRIFLQPYFNNLQHFIFYLNENFVFTLSLMGLDNYCEGRYMISYYSVERSNCFESQLGSQWMTSSLSEFLKCVFATSQLPSSSGNYYKSRS